MTNLAVVLVLGIIVNVLGLNRFISAQGLNLTSLLGFALIMGFGGAFISLLISKPVAKWSSGVRVINDPQNADEAWIVDKQRSINKGDALQIKGYANRAVRFFSLFSCFPA